MLSGKKILITGASGSIGSEMARVFAAAGADLLLSFANNKEKAEELRLSLPRPNAHQLIELRQENWTQNLGELNKHDSFLQALDGLVHASGIHESGPLTSLSEEDIVKQIQVNLTSVILLTQYVSKFMVKNRRGSILTLGSVSAHRMIRGHSVYSASKAGIEGFTKALAAELAKRGVRVNCILPGPVMSAMLQKSILETGDDPSARVPLQKLVETGDIAQAALFLFSEHAKMITGVCLPVDGGYLLW